MKQLKGIGISKKYVAYQVIKIPSYALGVKDLKKTLFPKIDYKTRVNLKQSKAIITRNSRPHYEMINSQIWPGQGHKTKTDVLDVFF